MSQENPIVAAIRRCQDAGQKVLDYRLGDGGVSTASGFQSASSLVLVVELPPESILSSRQEWEQSQGEAHAVIEDGKKAKSN